MSFFERPLKKALYTFGSLATAGVIAFTGACSQSPKPVPTVTPHTTIQLQRPTTTTPSTAPTSTTQTTTRISIPVINQVYPSGLPFNSILVKIPTSMQVITVAEFSRSSNLQREGWDIVEGKLRYHSLPNSAYDAESSYLMGFQVKGREDLHTLRLHSDLSVVWEGGGNIGLSIEDNVKHPFNAAYISFKFDVPKIVKDINFQLYARVASSDDMVVARNAEFSGDVPGRINDLTHSIVPGVNSFKMYKTNDGRNIAVGAFGIMSIDLVDNNLYSKWFDDQLKKSQSHILNVFSKNFTKYERDLVGVKLIDYKNVDSRLEFNIELRNLSTTEDVDITPSLIPLYLMAADGSVVKEYPDVGLSVEYYYDKGVYVYSQQNLRTIYKFEVSKNKVPPGYTSIGTLKLPLSDSPAESKYLVAILSVGESTLSRYVVIDL